MGGDRVMSMPGMVGFYVVNSNGFKRIQTARGWTVLLPGGGCVCVSWERNQQRKGESVHVNGSHNATWLHLIAPIILTPCPYDPTTWLHLIAPIVCRASWMATLNIMTRFPLPLWTEVLLLQRADAHMKHTRSEERKKRLRGR